MNPSIEQKQEQQRFELEIGVRAIKLLASSLNPDFSLEKNLLKVGYGFRHKILLEKDEIVIDVIVKYSTDDNEAEIASVQVSNTFILKNLSSFQSNQDNDQDIVNIPDSVMHTFMMMVISHTRALAAQHLANSPLEDFLPPLVPIDHIKQYIEDLSRM